MVTVYMFTLTHIENTNTHLDIIKLPLNLDLFKHKYRHLNIMENIR